MTFLSRWLLRLAPLVFALQLAGPAHEVHHDHDADSEACTLCSLPAAEPDTSPPTVAAPQLAGVLPTACGFAVAAEPNPGIPSPRGPPRLS